MPFYRMLKGYVKYSLLAEEVFMLNSDYVMVGLEDKDYVISYISEINTQF